MKNIYRDFNTQDKSYDLFYACNMQITDNNSTHSYRLKYFNKYLLLPILLLLSSNNHNNEKSDI